MTFYTHECQFCFEPFTTDGNKQQVTCSLHCARMLQRMERLKLG